MVGSPQSSNSLRLVEVAKRAGCANAQLIERAADISWGLTSRASPHVGVTAGASAPESLVEEVIGAFRERFDVTLETVTTARETSPSTCRASCEPRPHPDAYRRRKG